MRIRSLIIIAALAAPIGAPAQQEQQEVTLCYGVYTQFYRIPEALPDAKVTTCNARSDGIVGFPAPETLAKQAALILSNVSGGEFSAEQVTQMKAYLEGGGGLLVLGGPFTLGEGELVEKGIAEWLPVEIAPVDLRWDPAGAVALPATGAAQVLTGPQPLIFWYHQVKPRPGAEVLMRVGQDPLLITGRYGKGKVAVFTGTPLGAPQEGQIPFWQSEAWPMLLRHTVNWLAAREG